MNNLSIFFLATRQITKRDYDRFGIEIIKKKGCRVKFLECSFIFRKDHHLAIGGDKVNFSFEDLKIFKDLNLLKKYIINEKPTICINILGNTLRENIFLNYVSKYSNLLKLSVGIYPLYTHTKKNIILKKISQHSLIDLITYLLTFLINNYYNQKISYKYFVECGNHSKKFYKISDNKKLKLIKAHSFDYDNFLAFNYKKKQSKKYFIFLDKGGSSHPDHHFNKINNKADYKDYYEKIDLFLDKVSLQTNLHPLVLAHPKSNIEYIKKLSNSHIVQNNSIKYIYESELVFSYSSVAISYAVLFKKPIIIYSYNFTGFSKYQNIFYYNENSAFADELDVEHILINEYLKSDLKIDIKNISKERYFSYINNYIKTPNSPKKSIWEIILENISKESLI